jgi:hypothetical protein
MICRRRSMTHNCGARMSARRSPSGAGESDIRGLTNSAGDPACRFAHAGYVLRVRRYFTIVPIRSKRILPGLFVSLPAREK